MPTFRYVYIDGNSFSIIGNRNIAFSSVSSTTCPSPALLEATRAGDKDLAKKLLDSGADSNARDGHGFALTQAIRGRYPELAELLLEKGGDPNARDGHGPALTQAIRGRYPELAELLLEKGGDPNARDGHGPALTQAIRERCPALVKLLLEKKANPNARDGHGPALTQAIRGRYPELAELLLEKGGDPNARDGHGSALMQANAARYPEVVKLLLARGPNQIAKGDTGARLSKFSQSDGRDAKTDALVSQSIEGDIKEGGNTVITGDSPLKISPYLEDEEWDVISEVISEEADPQSRQATPELPLPEACAENICNSSSPNGASSGHIEQGVQRIHGGSVCLDNVSVAPGAEQHFFGDAYVRDVSGGEGARQIFGHASPEQLSNLLRSWQGTT